MADATILLTLADGLHYRYLLDTGIARRLRQAGNRVIVLTTGKVAAQARNRDSSLTFHALPQAALTPLQRSYLFLRGLNRSVLTETLSRKAEQERQQHPIKHLIRRTLAADAFAPLTGAAADMLSRTFAGQEIEALFDRYRPDLLVLSTPGQKLFDVLPALVGRRRGIRSVSPVYSWDNLTSKGPLFARPDHLLVWNEVMAGEAMRYHQFEPDRVTACGVPVFDHYAAIAANGDEAERAAFCRQVGLDPARRTVTVTTIPRIYFGDSHLLLVARISAFLQRTPELRDVQILVRPHQMDETDYDAVRDLPNVVLDAEVGQRDATLKAWFPPEDHLTKLALTMKHSDVVINLASTITIDAACFDTPVINIAYDLAPPEKRGYQGSVARYYDYTHYKAVVRTEAARMVRSDGELEAAIHDYLRDPALDRENRATLVAQQCGILDGRAGERTAAAILGLLRG